MIKMNLLKITLLSLVFFSCDSKKSVDQLETYETIAQNFISGLEAAKVKEWANPMNLQFRELIIKGGRPIGHVDYVGINYIEENLLYEKNVLLVTVKMLMEKPLFENREYKLEAKKIRHVKAEPDVVFKPVGSKIGTQIEGSKLYHCSIFYNITLKEFGELYSCEITHDGKKDLLMSPLLTKEINRAMLNSYKKSIQKGKAASGVFSSDIRF